MFRILKLVLLAAATNCAPSATFIPLATPLAQPYFFIGPQPQNQFQYQPLLKIQQPVAPAPASKIDSPKGQYIFLYPGAPQYPLWALRQEEGSTPDFFEQINNWWSDLSSSFNQNPAEEQPADPTTGGEKMEKVMLGKNMENMQGLLPASTMQLNMNKRRFYLLNSAPQFYTNFAALPTANPILAIEPLRARSAVDSIPSESEKIEQVRAQDLVEPLQQPAVVQPIPQLQLRSNIVEPLQRLEISQPQIPIVENEPVPEIAAEELARFLNEAATNTENKVPDNNQLRAGEPKEEEMSVAQANPSGIAISGKGGVSSSSSVATAVVGEGGKAVAAPSAISVSGDFDDIETKLKETETFTPL